MQKESLITKKMFYGLFLYHTLFCVLSYYYIRYFDGDASHYWARKTTIDYSSWRSFINYGSDFLILINYPLIKLEVPFFIGFFIYSCIGFLGIMNFIRFATIVLHGEFRIKQNNLIVLLFLLPSLHFWTSMLGKEAPVFWGISAVFYSLVAPKIKLVQAFIGFLMVLLIRPHVALMLFTAIGIVYFFNRKYTIKQKFGLVFLGLLVNIALVFMVFRLSKINYWNWQRIQAFNQYSIVSFEKSGSYVPMLEYNYLYKIFSFCFRPLFFDSNSIFGLFSSIENGIVLILYAFGVFCTFKNYKNLVFPIWVKVSFLFTFIAVMLYIQRYANLGIFMRTKMMFMPYASIAFLFIIKQSFKINTNNEEKKAN